jgi:hypothetical protein
MEEFKIPDNADLVFEGLAEGDEDFFSEQCGHLNVSLAYRELQKIGARIIKCHVPRADIPGYRKLRDVDSEHVERVKAQGSAAVDRPVLIAELTPGDNTLIDGIHRLMAKAELEPHADPIVLRAYVVPHRCLDLIRVKVYFRFDDGRIEPINHSQYLAWSWGKHTRPEDGQRSAS